MTWSNPCRHNIFRFDWKPGFAAALVIMSISGCGGAPDGVKRYPVTGTITYEGKPVPKGQIFFEPDTSKGNKGPGSMAQIDNGIFKTDGLGHVGGPHVARIRGYLVQTKPDLTPYGEPMFPEYETNTELPRSAGTCKFEVTEAAVAAAVKAAETKAQEKSGSALFNFR